MVKDTEKITKTVTDEFDDIFAGAIPDERVYLADGVFPQAIEEIIEYVDCGKNEWGAELRGMGLPVALRLVLDIAAMSTIIVAPMGTGKSIAIEKLISCPHLDKVKDKVKVVSLENVTRTALAGAIGEWTDGRITLLIEDISTFSNKQNHVETFSTRVAKAISNPQEGIQDAPTKDTLLDTRGSKVQAVIGAQVGTFMSLTKSPLWGTITSDRFLRVMLLNPIKGLQVNTDTVKLNVPIAHYIDVDSVTISSKMIKWLGSSTLTDMIARQYGAGRRGLYVASLLKAFAALCGENKVTKKTHDNFVYCFSPYISVINMFTSSDFSYEETMGNETSDAAALYVLATQGIFGLDWVDAVTLTKEFGLVKTTKAKKYDSSRRMLAKGMSTLIDKGLVEREVKLATLGVCEECKKRFISPKSTKCGCGAKIQKMKRDTAFFRLGGFIAEFFKNYDSTIRALCKRK
jgi:hypothetical protein